MNVFENDMDLNYTFEVAKSLKSRKIMEGQLMRSWYFSKDLSASLLILRLSEKWERIKKSSPDDCQAFSRYSSNVGV